MNVLDLFVGSVSIGLGVLALVAALFNWNASYQLDKARWLEDQWGRSTLRWIYALVGLVLVALGVAIAAGIGPPASKPSGGTERASPARLLSYRCRVCRWFG
jgi:hypothetical protein